MNILFFAREIFKQNNNDGVRFIDLHRLRFNVKGSQLNIKSYTIFTKMFDRIIRVRGCRRINDFRRMNLEGKKPHKTEALEKKNRFA